VIFLPWIGFLLLILALLAFDLGVFHRRPHAQSSREALGWSGLWIGLSLSFNVLVYFLYERRWLGVGREIGLDLGGSTAALQFFTGYLIELSLSLDNVFVIGLVISYFSVPLAYQHRVLFWGVLGALVLRGVMIAAGAALIARFHWTIYVFGLFLLGTAVHLLVKRQDTIDPERSLLVRAARRIFPMTDEVHGDRFFVRVGGRLMMTPLFLVVLVVESSDVIFAVDSIPAIFAVTQDPFLVFTSNIFAILGLRSLYFALAPLIERFVYLKTSLVFILAFVGMKMLLNHHYPIPTAVSLAMIAGILGVGVAASILASRRDAARPAPALPPLGVVPPEPVPGEWRRRDAEPGRSGTLS
jgi:tellurite resistance protein TerC